MTRFNNTVKFTKEYRTAILAAIKNRKKNPAISSIDCAACQLTKTLNNNYMQCTICPIGATEKDALKEQYGWCGTYAINVNERTFKTEKDRLAYLDKMEAAVRKKKVEK